MSDSDALERAAIARLLSERELSKWQRLRRGLAVVIFTLRLPGGRSVFFGRIGVKGWRNGMRWRLRYERRYHFGTKSTGVYCDRESCAEKRVELRLEGRAHAEPSPWVYLYLYCPSCRCSLRRPAEIAYSRATTDEGSR